MPGELRPLGHGRAAPFAKLCKKKKKNNPLVQGLSLVVVAAVSPFLSLFFVQAVFFRAT